jgi:capsular exopolysaccharide synthesis family protein
VKQGPDVLDLKQALGVLLRRLPAIVLCAVVVAGAAYAFSKRETKKYTTTASVVFNNNSQLAQQLSGVSTPSTSNSLLAQQATDLELLKTGDMAARTARRLGHGLTEQQVAENLSVSGRGESGIVDVSVTATSPVLAARIANTYVRLFAEEQVRANRANYKELLDLVRKQLAALTPKQRTGADGLNLQNRAQTLSILSELKHGSVGIAEEAGVPTSPSSPKTRRNALIGGVLGLFIGFALAFILEGLDRRIKRPEDLEAIYQRPLLGAVPRSRALARKGGTLPPAEAEAFGLIRGHLRFFNIDRDLHTVAIVSPSAGEGKSTIARRLAESAARSGSRVLLLELDLRHPTLAERLGVDSGPGVVDVLIGAARLDEATKSIALQTTSAEQPAAGRTLDVLVAGAVPPNPSELIESRAMEAVLEHVRSTYDLVVVDTPSLIDTSDALPLLTSVDGVVVVGRVQRSRRAAAERLSQILSANSEVPLLGVIANASKAAEGRGSYHRPRQPTVTAVTANGASSPDASEAIVSADNA